MKQVLRVAPPCSMGPNESMVSKSWNGVLFNSITSYKSRLNMGMYSLSWHSKQWITSYLCSRDWTLM